MLGNVNNNKFLRPNVSIVYTAGMLYACLMSKDLLVVVLNLMGGDLRKHEHDQAKSEGGK
jgi:hypothetical protein